MSNGGFARIVVLEGQPQPAEVMEPHCSLTTQYEMLSIPWPNSIFGLSLCKQTRSLLSFRPTRRNIHTLTILQPWLNTRCSLGEGPFWEEETNTIRFVDIEKQSLMRVDLNKGPSSLKTVKEHDISMG